MNAAEKWGVTMDDAELTDALQAMAINTSNGMISKLKQVADNDPVRFSALFSAAMAKCQSPVPASPMFAPSQARASPPPVTTPPPASDVHPQTQRQTPMQVDQSGAAGAVGVRRADGMLRREGAHLRQLCLRQSPG